MITSHFKLNPKVFERKLKRHLCTSYTKYLHFFKESITLQILDKNAGKITC